MAEQGDGAAEQGDRAAEQGDRAAEQGDRAAEQGDGVVAEKGDGVAFVVGEKFSSYDELKAKVSTYEKSRCVQLCRSDSRTLDAARKRVPRKVESAKKDLVYYRNLIYLACLVVRSTSLKAVERDLTKVAIHSGRLVPGNVVITMSYGLYDQQTVAACSIFSQMCWLRSYNLGQHTVIVEPFSNMSHFEHSPKHWTAVDKNLKVMRFSDYFDLDHFQRTACRDENGKSTNLVKWETFLHSAPRDVIAVTMQHLSGDTDKCFSKIGRPDLACKSGPRNQTQIDYFTSGCNTTEIDEAMNYLKHHGFRVVKHVCLNCERGLPSSGYSPDIVMDLISGGGRLRNKTVLINTWMYSLNLVKKCQFHQYCSNCVKFYSNDYKKLLPSQRLKDDAKRYLRNILNATSVSVAIMVRSERLFGTLKSTTKVLSIMDTLLQTYEKLLDKLSKDNDMQALRPFITIDIGRFGSDTYSTLCRECSNYTEIVAKFEQMLSHIYGKKWTLQRYENGLIYAVRGVMDGGYIAGVQRVLASEAKCLIMYGGGHYQALAEYHYMLQHPNKSERCISKSMW